MQLPASLRARMEDLLEGVSTHDLSRHYQLLSDRYRRQSEAASLQIRNEQEALAYMASRLPATYGAVADVCRRLRALWPDFQPHHLLDLGAGPGTATLAALEIWPSLQNLTLVEPNPYLRKIAEDLIPEKIMVEPAALATRTPHRADLVLLSYVLNELPPVEITAEIERIWPDVTTALVVIEPGTPLGFQTIHAVREKLLQLGAELAAPCPHMLACPLKDSDRWCHFSVRIDRPSFHRRVKGDASLGHEDEKFSYVVATRTSLPKPAARIIGHPHGSKLIELEVCEKDGHAATRVFSKRDPLYKTAKKSAWGDGL